MLLLLSATAAVLLPWRLSLTVIVVLELKLRYGGRERTSPSNNNYYYPSAVVARFSNRAVARAGDTAFSFGHDTGEKKKKNQKKKQKNRRKNPRRNTRPGVAADRKNPDNNTAVDVI